MCSLRSGKNGSTLKKLKTCRSIFSHQSKTGASISLMTSKNRTGITITDVSIEFKSIYHDPEQKMISAETIKQIQEAIQDLPPRCRLIFKLVKEEGLKYKEVAELLQLSVKTVENQMSVAFKKNRFPPLILSSTSWMFFQKIKKSRQCLG
jgi:RNA polymerase sigma-70 factor (ECF subfamily)